MSNATPGPRHNDDELTIHVARPAGLTNQQWEDRKIAIGMACAPVVDEVLGHCAERPWCQGVAGTPDHDQFHASDPVDIIPGPATNGEPFGVSAWLVENRGDRRPQLVLDGHLPGSREAFMFEVDVAYAAYLLQIAQEGASNDPAVDATTLLFNLMFSTLDSADLAARIGGAR